MKKIWKVKDNQRGFIEVQILERNNVVPEDLIWLHFKTEKGHKKYSYEIDSKGKLSKYKKRIEDGWAITPWEARIIIQGLFLALDYIIEQYKLEKFRIKGRSK